ncbi:MAG: sn-glycerol-3-phosphate ABC transporter ATP-binding protein UgpC [Phycisphaerae bacterium]
MAQVLLEKVSKVYPGGVQAVREVDLAIHDSEFVVLVGPSGCGKTTTLRMIAGLEEISGGNIKIGERVVNDVPPKDRDIAMVFQNYALYPHMSVYKNMAFGLQLRKMPKDQIRQRVMDAAKILGIDHLMERKPKALSGGQRQRVAVGRAIVRQPKAFLFDEPLSNLDAKMRVETRAELKKLHRRLKTTTIYVTHDQEEAMTLGDRVVVMKDGEVQQVDNPLAIYDRPVNKFVAGFLGTPPMNLFTGRIVYRNQDVYFDEGANLILLPAKWRERLARYKDQKMVLGVRPENLYPKAEGAFAGRDNSMKVKIEVVELLGDKMDLYMASANHSHIICRIDSHAGLKEGQEILMYMDVNRVHVFSDDIGVNVTLEHGSGG